MTALPSERIINGTYGECWLDGEYVAECYGLQAKVDFEKEEVPVCGKPGIDTKITGYKGKGTAKLYKVNSRMALKISDQVKSGINPRFQILSVLDDPAAYGAERVLVKDICFDDLTLFDWEAKKQGEIEAPFTFTDWDLVDQIQPVEG